MTWVSAAGEEPSYADLLSPDAGFSISHLLGETPQWFLARAVRLPAIAGASRSVLIRLLKKRFPLPHESAVLRHELDLTRRLGVEGVVRGVAVVEHEHRVFLVLDDPGGRPLMASRLPLRTVLVLGIRLAEILEGLHHQHVIHKNVQPGNLIFDPETGRLCLTDFTIASSLGHEQLRLRSPSTLEGSLAYMSPEQTGRANRLVDYRSDFYSAGVTLYQLLSGCLPFDSDDPMEVVHGHLARRPLSPSELDPTIPGPVSGIVERLLAKTAEERYQSAAGWRADLEKCLGGLDERGAVDVFDLGRLDRSPVFSIPQRLYGREADRESLLAAFERVAGGATEIVGVAGPSGIGKTFLVHELHGPMVKARGWFVAGKYNRNDMGVPYHGLIEAFSDLVRQILTESPVEVEHWRARILDALGPNGQVMVEVLPDISLIVGEQSPLPSLPPGQAQARFARVFLDFVRVFARVEHPLVVFLDDLQWADAATLKWMQLLLGDPECRHVLLIGAWRDNEVGPSHPLPVILEELRRGGVPVHVITLGPLEPEQVTRIVADTLGSPPARVRQLADLLWQKTHGNPFFVHRLFSSLSSSGLVGRDPASGQWSFDFEGIQQLACSDNVVEFMAREVARLPERSREILALASCFGNQFGLFSLAAVLGTDVAEAAADLRPAVTRGLLVPQGEAARYVHESPRGSSGSLVTSDRDVRYRFLHDRVRQAVDDMLDDSGRRHLHLRIGRLLLASTPPEQVEARVFDIVSHWNVAVSLVTDPRERRTLAELNFTAGSRGRDTTAYEAALEHVTLACQLLGDDAWQSAPELAFNLYRERALCEGLCGNLAKADEFFELARWRARTVADRIEAGIAQVGLYTITQRKPEAVRLGLRLLREAGQRLPEEVGQVRLAWELARARWLRGRRRVAHLADLPVLHDPTRVAVATLLMELCKPAYTLGKLNLMAALCLRLVNLSLRHGNTAVSAFGYNLYGMILGSTFGAYEMGLECGRVSLELNQRFEDRRLRSAVYWQVAFALLPWRSHVRNCARYFREGYLSGVQCGDTFYAAASVCCMGTYTRISGETQDLILAQVEQYRSFMKWSRERNYYHAHLLVQQDALCLQGRTESLMSLSDGTFDEATCVAEMEDDQYLSGLCFHAIGKLRLCYLYGDLPQAAIHARRAHQTIPALALTLFEPELCFYETLLTLALLPDLRPRERARQWRQVKANLARMSRWADNCADNFLHKRLLIEAEVARADGRSEEAFRLYGRAIEEARRTEFLQHEALAHERVADLHRSLGRTEAARVALKAACYVYAKWGAHAKVAHLEQNSPELLEAGMAERDAAGAGAPPAARAVTLSALDAWSMVRATQSISTEITVSGLLGNLMARLMENAGAERGVLMLAREESLAIAAEGFANGACTVLATPVDLEGRVPISVVRYVERTGRSALLDEAARDALFGSDPYVVSLNLRSVLCAPILYQGRLTGVVYLENRLIGGAFTAERLEVLSVLAAQAAISIENARLIEQLEESNRLLEQRVAERTEQLSEKNTSLAETNARLKATQNELVQKQKMAWMGTLTQGIAHEIRNPLGLVKNFAEVSQEMTQEMRALLSLRTVGGDAAEGGGSSCQTDDAEGLLALVERNLGKILEHGARADQIVKSMLMHSPDGPADLPQPVSLNALLVSTAENVLARSRRDSVLLVSDLDPSLEPIDAMVRDLARAFTNILQNALDALEEMPPSSDPGYRPSVRLQTRELGTHVEVRIRDNGPGIALENRDRVFTPFFTTRAAGRGTGLGLSLTYDIIVHGHRGELALNTEVGSHCEFVMRLPRSRPPGPGDSASETGAGM